MIVDIESNGPPSKARLADSFLDSRVCVSYLIKYYPACVIDRSSFHPEGEYMRSNERDDIELIYLSIYKIVATLMKYSRCQNLTIYYPNINHILNTYITLANKVCIHVKEVNVIKL